MGNRAVITTKYNYAHNGIGIYLHWNGGRDSVEGFLTYCKMKGYRSPDTDIYGWASLANVISNFFSCQGMCIGLDKVKNLDCDNYDNGVYLIEGWEIVDRKFMRNNEQYCYNLEEMLIEIDEHMPKKEQLGKDRIEYLLKEYGKEDK